MMQKKMVIIGAVAAVAISACMAAEIGAAVSPDGRNVIRLHAAPLAYEVLRDGVVVAARSGIGVCLDGTCLVKGISAAASVSKRTLAGTVPAPTYKKAGVSLAGNETLADFGDFAVRLVARNDGVAYRLELKKAGIITNEKADLTVPKAARCWYNRTSRGSLGSRIRSGARPWLSRSPA